MDLIVVIGSAGHAKVVIDVLEREGQYRIAGLIDHARRPGEETFGYPVLGAESDLPQLVTEHALRGAIVAIGDNYRRAEVTERIAGLCPGLPFVTAVHPRASVGRGATIGEGTVVMAGAVVNPCCTIGRGCLLNTNSSLDHDSSMEDFSSLAPRAATGGNCTIGRCSAIGIGAVLIHGVTIGEHTVIGAGSTVLKDVPSFAVAYGAPAAVVRKRTAGERYL